MNTIFFSISDVCCQHAVVTLANCIVKSQRLHISYCGVDLIGLDHPVTSSFKMIASAADSVALRNDKKTVP
jgi:hypothetical protein